MPYLSQLDSGRNNNFDLIRFIAAILVIFSHCFLVTNTFKNEPLYKLCGFLDFGALGVKIFFSISGYLIIKSLYRQPTLGSFVWARFLRIFPGLLLTALFCAFIIGPLCTKIPLAVYFSSKEIYDFLWRLATLHNFPNILPGTFKSNPYPNAVNNPVWTLPAELLMYLLVLCWGVLLLIFKREYVRLKAALPVLIIVALFFWGIPYQHWYSVYLFLWGILFLSGTCCYIFRDKIPVNFIVLLGGLVVFCLLFHFRSPGMHFAFDLLLVYGILVFAYHPKLQISGFRKLGDFSYGLYIYAFPIQQALILNYPALKPVVLFIITFGLTLLLAIPSWYLVEKPILKLKHVRLITSNS